MFVIVFCLACMVFLDALALLFDPSLYRRGMEFVENEVGPAWMVASGFAFLAPGAAWLVQSIALQTTLLSTLAGCVSVLIGLFFILGATERFAFLGQWWRSRSNGQYRLAGIAGILLATRMLILAFELRL